jgi:hypothetical protein
MEGQLLSSGTEKNWTRSNLKAVVTANKRSVFGKGVEAAFPSWLDEPSLFFRLAHYGKPSRFWY